MCPYRNRILKILARSELQLLVGYSEPPIVAIKSEFDTRLRTHKARADFDERDISAAWMDTHRRMKWHITAF
jgi:hypothetical protein